MRMLACLGGMLAAAALSLAAPSMAAAPVSLRPVPVAHGETVTLSDVFDGELGAAGRTVLSQAAGPGLRVSLDAGQVQMVARSAGLDWANAQGIRRIMVATAGAPTGEAPRSHHQALAYTRNIAAGEIIQASDLMWSSEVIASADAPGDPDRMIGQAARRPLRAGAAAQGSDLVAPVVIHRDETVDVAFEAGGIRVVLQGKAMKDAAIGASVQVMNPQSNKIIEAVAAGPGKAVVGPRADALKAAPFATASLR